MQYHTLQDKNTSTTLEETLCNSNTFFTMVVVCVELMETVQYLHNEASLLHNDSKV